MRLTLGEIWSLLGSDPALLPAGLAACTPAGASMDSRDAQQGKLFFCSKGERTDGHEYAGVAAEKGAMAIVACRDPFPGGKAPVPVLATEDTVKALGCIAAAERAATRAHVVGVTGSSGKTSVKETLAAVLGVMAPTAKTHMNFNNRIGLPLSMLNAREDAAYWVMEAGISETGDMDELASILRPDMAVIVNAGLAHMQGLGDKGVAHYKSRMLAYVPENGMGVISADYPDLVREAQQYGRRLVTFSTREGAALFTAKYAGQAADGSGVFSVVAQDDKGCVEAPFAGAFGAENVAAVTAAVCSLGYGLDDVRRGAPAARLPAGRFTRELLGPYLIIDDSYNANPLSMQGALAAAAQAAKARSEELFLVLGEMGELGLDAERSHEALGRYIAELRPGWVIWRGGHGEIVERTLRGAGFAGAFAVAIAVEDFSGLLQRFGQHPGVYLFKGSRSNMLERFVEAFQEAAREKGVLHAL